MITNVRLQHFRSYTDESFEVDPGVNIIVGPNASGKTNMLEAILVGCLGVSYRVKDTDLIQFDQSWTRIDLGTDQGDRTVKIIQKGVITTKEFVINSQPFKRLSLQKTVPVVLFEPNHLRLLTGSPDARRDYLDDLLEQLVVGYATTRRQYRRALAQRNKLLKLGRNQADSQLFAWNIRLSQLGGEVAAHRTDLVRQLGQDIQTLYRKLSHSKATVDVLYSTNCDSNQYSSDLLHKLESNTDQDFERGFTSYGPHRDDLEIRLNGKLMSSAASRGETRTMLLALKIIEMSLIESIRNQKPILLLDDVFSELDGARRRALTETLASHQTFITTTDADVVVEHFMGSCNVIPLG